MESGVRETECVCVWGGGDDEARLFSDHHQNSRPALDSRIIRRQGDQAAGYAAQAGDDATSRDVLVAWRRMDGWMEMDG